MGWGTWRRVGVGTERRGSSMTSRYFSAQARRTREPPISWLMRLKLERPDWISLAAGFTDDETLPVGLVRALTRRILARPATARAALQYGTTAGLPALRAVLLARLQQQDGAPYQNLTAEDVVITNGSQQLLYLITEALCDPGDIVLVEDPTYFVYLSILEARGVTPVPFGSLEELAIRLDQLRRRGQLARLKMMYLVTYFRNPTGQSWSWAMKEEAYRLMRRFERAAGHPIFIVEDAAYRDLRFAGVDVPSFMKLDAGNRRVLYTNTLTKPFATGLKVGYGVLPAAVRIAVLRAKGNHDFGTSSFVQAIVEQALSGGQYERHLRRLAQAYGRKCAVLSQALGERFPHQRPEGGLYIWTQTPDQQSTGFRSRLFRRALDAGVLYVPGELCFAGNRARSVPRHFMRLSFGAPTLAQIREGVRRLRTACEAVDGGFIQPVAVAPK